jgi:hypothetical protein
MTGDIDRCCTFRARRDRPSFAASGVVPGAHAQLVGKII